MDRHFNLDHARESSLSTNFRIVEKDCGWLFSCGVSDTTWTHNIRAPQTLRQNTASYLEKESRLFFADGFKVYQMSL